MLQRSICKTSQYTILISACLAALATETLARDYATPTALTHVKIVPGEGQTIEDGTIVMDEGRIVAVGAAVEIPAFAEVIDGTGCVAYPGFIDAHSYLGIAAQERSDEERQRLEDETPDRRWGPYVEMLAASRRGIRPQVKAYDLFKADEGALDKHRQMGMTAALAAPRTGILSGYSMLVSTSDSPLRRLVLRDAVAQHASFSPGEPGTYPETAMGAMAQFRQFMHDVDWYGQLKQYESRNPTNGERSPTDTALEIGQAIRKGSLPLVFEANSEPEIHRALDLAAEFKLPVIISGAKDAWRVTDRLKSEQVKLIVSLKFDEEPEYDPKTEEERAKKYQEDQDPEHPALFEPLKQRMERRRLWEEQVANVIRLHEAGIKFALGSREFEQPGEMMRNLRTVIERGLPVDSAVEALSKEPARIFGLEDQLGSIAAGKLANLTVMTSPLDEKDEKKKPRVRWVFSDGKKFEFDIEEARRRHKKKLEDLEEAGPNGEAGDKQTPEDVDPWMDKDEEKKEEKVAGEAKKDAPATEKPAAGETAVAQPAATGDKPAEKPPVFPMPEFAVEIEAERRLSPRTGGNVLMNNATIITMAGETIENGGVLVKDGKIAAVGKDIAATDGVTVIDGKGRYVIPGFVDAHSHMAIDDVNEGTVSISPEVKISDVVTNKQVAVYRAVAGGMTTMHSMHGSANTIGGQNVILKLKYGKPVKEWYFKDAPRTVKFALGENVKQSNWGRERGTRFPGTRMGVETTLRRAFEGATRYLEELSEFGKKKAAGEDAPPVRKDLRLDALADIMNGLIYVQCHCYRADEILRLLQVAEDYGFRIQTLQHVLEGYRITPEIARHGCGASTFSNYWAYKIEAYDAIPHNAAAMIDAGICASINSDSPDYARYFGLESAKSLKWGWLDEREALALSTINPARQLGIDKQVGSIEVGKDGDLAIFDGHPLNAFSKCVMTLIEGEVYFEHSTPAEVPHPLPKLITEEPQRVTPQSAEGLYAIVGATLHPVSGPAIENGTVLIRGGLIEALGDGLKTRNGDTVIDGTGLHVYPGLIDVGSRLGLMEIDSVAGTDDLNDLARFQPDNLSSSAVNPFSVHVNIARTSGITTALVQPGGGYIAGQSSLIHLSGWSLPEMLVADGLFMHMSVPVLPVILPEKDRDKRIDEHKKNFKLVEGWVTKAKLYGLERQGDPSAPPDPALEAMLPYAMGQKPVVIRADSYKAILRSIEFAEKHELKMILSEGREAWKLADQLAEKKIPVIVSTPLSYPSSDYEPWDSVYRNAGVLDKAGVQFCFGTDDAANAYNLPFHAGMAVAHGLDPERAVRALTLGAAQIIGLDEKLGSLEPGKVADVIVTTDTPIQTACQVMYMFINGKPVELDDNKHTRDYRRFKERPTPELPPAKELRGPKSLTTNR